MVIRHNTRKTDNTLSTHLEPQVKLRESLAWRLDKVTSSHKPQLRLFIVYLSLDDMVTTELLNNLMPRTQSTYMFKKRWQ